MNKRHLFFFVFILTALSTLSNYAFAQKDIAVPKMEKYLLLNGINLKECHRAKSYQNLINLFDTHLAFCEEDSKYAEKFLPDKDYGIHTHFSKIERDDKEKLTPYLETGKEMLTQHQSLPMDNEDKKYACLMASRLLYAFVSIAHVGEGRTNKDTRKILKSILMPNKLSYPASIKKFKKERLGKYQGRKEASFLKTNGKYMAALTSRQVSKLDIRDDDPMYYSDKDIKGKAGEELAQSFYGKINHALTQWLRKKYKDDNINYVANNKSKTVFLKQIKGVYHGAGNNPKFKTHDEYNVNYKLKLGKERVAEAITNHLHLAMGGKFSDINFFHSFQNPVIVVLHKKTKENKARYLKLMMGNYNPPEIETLCSKIDSYKMFKLCFQRSRYGFKKLDTFVLEHGTITSENFNKIVKFDKSPIKGIKDVVGREYVIMKEASTEIKNKKIYQTASGIAASTIGAKSMRSMRAHGLFEMFIDNLDAKDLNFKGVVLSPKYFPEIANRSATYRYMEYPSDTGSALARFFISFKKRGTLNRNTYPVTWQENKLINNRFLIRSPFLPEKKLLYNNTALYAPYSWEVATTADNTWMARRIVHFLTDEVIENAVNLTNMPDMWRMNVTWRLIKRRNQIAHFYGLDKNKRYKATKKVKKSLSIPLRTYNERLEAAKRYQIPVEKINQEMVRRKLIKRPKGQCHYQDVVLRNGFVSKPKRSVINSILNEMYPSGIGF